MMKFNRLKASWSCPHCGEESTINRIRLSAEHPRCLVDPREVCSKPPP